MNMQSTPVERYLTVDIVNARPQRCAPVGTHHARRRQQFGLRDFAGDAEHAVRLVALAGDEGEFIEVALDDQRHIAGAALKQAIGQPVAYIRPGRRRQEPGNARQFDGGEMGLQVDLAQLAFREWQRNHMRAFDPAAQAALQEIEAANLDRQLLVVAK